MTNVPIDLETCLRMAKESVDAMRAERDQAMAEALRDRKELNCFREAYLSEASERDRRLGAALWQALTLTGSIRLYRDGKGWQGGYRTYRSRYAATPADALESLAKVIAADRAERTAATADTEERDE